MTLLEGFPLRSLEILRSYYLLEISLFMLPHPSPVLHSHTKDIPFTAVWSISNGGYAISENIRQAGNNQKNLEQYSFAYEMVRVLRMTG